MAIFAQVYKLFTIFVSVSLIREILRGSIENLKLKIRSTEAIHAKGKGYELN